MKIDIQGELKPTEENYYAFNGDGFFPVYDSQDNLLLTRNGNFSRIKKYIVNSEGHYLVGYPWQIKQFTAPQKPNFHHEQDYLCYEFEKLGWMNGTYTLERIFADNVIKQNYHEIKPQLEKITWSSLKDYAARPTTYIKFNMNLKANEKGNYIYKLDWNDYYTKFFTPKKIIEKGDIVNISFEGRVNNTKFPGGTASSYDLKIGSNSFIDNFEDQLLDKHIGQELNIKVTFPENYSVANLAAQKADFKVTINSIVAKKDMDGDIASMYTDSFNPNFIQPFKIYDSLANQHILNCYFRYIGFNQWGVEIYSRKEEKEMVLSTPLEKILANGILKFDDYGNLINSEGRLDSIDLRWKNGGYNNIKLDFSEIKFRENNYSGANIEVIDVKSSVLNAKIYKAQLNDSSNLKLDGQDNSKLSKNFFINYKGDFIVGDEEHNVILYNLPIYSISSKGNYINGKITNLISTQLLERYILLNNYYEIIKDVTGKNIDFSFNKSCVSYISKSVLPNKTLYTIDDNFIAIKCEDFDEVFFVQEFPVNSINNNCYLLKYIDDESKLIDLQPFKKNDYLSNFQSTTKINIGKHILDGNYKRILDVLKEKKGNKFYQPDGEEVFSIANGSIKSFYKHIYVPFYDNLGKGHFMRFGFVKIHENAPEQQEKWHVEIYLSGNKENILLTHGDLFFDKAANKIPSKIITNLKQVDESIENFPVNLGNDHFNVTVDWGINNKINNIIVSKNTDNKRPHHDDLAYSNGFPQSKLINLTIIDDYIYGNYQAELEKNKITELKLAQIAVIEVEDALELKKCYGDPGYKISEDIDYAYVLGKINIVNNANFTEIF